MMDEALKAQAQAAIDSETQGGPGKRSQASVLVDLARDAELFHTPSGDTFVTVSVNGHRETWRLRSKGFRSWLGRRHFEAKGGTPGAQGVQDALNVLEGIALYDGPEHRVSVRVGEHDGVTYLDLGDPDWRVVRIGPDGWEIVADSPVRFLRPSGLLPLPVPTHGGRISALQPFVNVSDDDWPLVLGYLVACLRPHGPYPILALHGEQGAAKTTTARVLRRLVDPNMAPMRAEPREPRDLAVTSGNNWCIAFDNLSRVPGWLSDALCRLSTGGGFATRALYTNEDEIIFDAQRPVMLTGITELATRGDLLDRCIVLHLPTITDDRRRPEVEFWRAFDDAAPAILGALLDAVSMAIRDVGGVRLDRLPRMADFAQWVVAAEPALELPPGAFLEAYTRNREAANESALEVSPLTEPLLALAKEGRWEGTATELLRVLSGRVDERTTRLKGWPSTGRATSDALRRLAPNLRAVGLSVDFPKGRRRGRLIVLEQEAQVSSSASSSSSTYLGAPAPEDDEDDRRTKGAPGRTIASPPHRYEEDDEDDEDARLQPHSSLGGAAWLDTL